MKKKAVSVDTTLARQLVIPLLLLWLLAMGLLTWAVAADFYRQLETHVRDCQEAAANTLQGGDGDLPGFAECNMLSQLRFSYLWLHPEPLLPIVLPQTPDSYGSDDWYWGKWELLFGFQAAEGYYDAQGQPCIVSGDHIWFSYAAAPDGALAGYGYIDLNELPGGGELADRYIDTYPLGGYLPFGITKQLKLTGYLEGGRFYPVEIVSRDDASEVFYTGSTEADRELVTVYPIDTWGRNYDPGGSFILNGKRYENAAALLEEDVSSRFGLFGAVLIKRRMLEDGGSAKIVVYCRPLAYAMLRLLPAYLVSLALIGAYLVWSLRRLRGRFTEPLDEINRSFAQNRVELSGYAHSPLQELQTLADHFHTSQKERHEAKNEVQQLRTALSYAQSAEENRRRMVSSIAHELKTPLAVIHSYAEGLQTGIAAQKQEKYLSVILEETEQMDAMVLEMLELSRLEAGKVRLSTDQFSLISLSRDIFDKLTLAVEAKQLQLEFRFWYDFTVTADEARICQVITNFATNAIKYTPHGGRILIRAYHSGGKAHFSIENEGPPLSEEVLSRVWDSFYRADTARTGSGTGLGLAIAKNIIELHRGTCSVRNTETGVEFSFELPA